MTFTPSDSTDYTTAAATVTVNVGQATPAVASMGVVTITYGTAYQFAAQRHGQLDGERQVGERSGDVHLHVRRGHGVEG